LRVLGRFCSNRRRRSARVRCVLLCSYCSRLCLRLQLRAQLCAQRLAPRSIVPNHRRVLQLVVRLIVTPVSTSPLFRIIFRPSLRRSFSAYRKPLPIVRKLHLRAQLFDPSPCARLFCVCASFNKRSKDRYWACAVSMPRRRAARYVRACDLLVDLILRGVEIPLQRIDLTFDALYRLNRRDIEYRLRRNRPASKPRRPIYIRQENAGTPGITGNASGIQRFRFDVWRCSQPTIRFRAVARLARL